MKWGKSAYLVWFQHSSTGFSSGAYAGNHSNANQSGCSSSKWPMSFVSHPRPERREDGVLRQHTEGLCLLVPGVMRVLLNQLTFSESADSVSDGTRVNKPRCLR